MDQSPAWEVYRSSANRELARNLWNSKGHNHIYKRPPSVLILTTASQPMSPDFFASNEFQIIGPNERKFSKWFRLCVISGSRRSINKICALWEFYTASISSFVPTFRGQTILSSRVCLTLEYGTHKLSRNIDTILPFYAA